VKQALLYSKLEQALEARLREILGSVDWLAGAKVEPAAPDAGVDLLATVPLPGGGTVVLCVECKSELRPSVFRQWAGKEFKLPGRPLKIAKVLALPFVSDRIAGLCVEYGWSWFDLAGNYRLDIPGVLRLAHSGNAPEHKRPRPAANLGTPEAGRVIRALLAPQNAGVRWTQLDMSRHFGELPRSLSNPSLGLVNKVVRHLCDEAFVERLPDGRFCLRDPMNLLFAWRDAYRFDRRVRQGYFSLVKGEKLREALAGLDAIPNGEAAYAAFSAADIQAPNVRQPKVWLYLSPSLEAEFCRRAEAKPVDSGDNVVVLTPNDDGIFYQCDAGRNRLPATNLVQTYVDLWHSGGRGHEAAEALLEHRLKPEWRDGGLKT
jgi:hypothetical protein